ncbi:glycosyltransferase family 2 protein [bacterium]|nr:glycosyltransferase family 2 protein [bacterium]
MDISVVIPLLNESESLPELHQQLTEVLSAMGQEYELVFVDDGSSDNSFAILEQLHENDSHIKVIRFQKNYGKAVGLSEGFALASGTFVITMDADLQDDPKEIPDLVAMLESGYDLVSGWKKKRFDPKLTKNLPSKLFNSVVAKAAGFKLHDFNCGLKGYRLEVTRSLRLYGQLHRFIPVLAHWNGFRVTEKIVEHHPRKYGESKYGLSRFTSGFFDLITIIFLSRFKKRPLHLFGSAGLTSFLAGLAITVYLAVERIFYQKYLSDRPLLWLGILLILIGVQFFGVGLIGEMITDSQAGKRTVLVRNRIGC